MRELGGQIWVIGLQYAEFDGHHGKSGFRALRRSKVEQFRILDGNFGCRFLNDENLGIFKFEFLAGKSLSVNIFTMKCCT